ncbi:hypothetical protein P886_3268 [Alteromonadaceae bacterium 2753L.S.0a.02]|nr:hypothetical protein P886_3268 [Alteromonadaceae bacterium 2753L.S.0a.02]
MLLVSLDLRANDEQFSAGIATLVTACIFAIPVRGVFVISAAHPTDSQFERIDMARSKLRKNELDPRLDWYSLNSESLPELTELLGEALSSKSYRQLINNPENCLLNF